MFLSQRLLRYILGALWLIDGLLQLQPQMFTLNMVDSVLLPTLQAQPAPVAASLHVITTIITQNLTLVNLLIAVVQVEIGLCLLSGIWVRGTIIVSIVWSLIVWYGGEGMSLLLTGQASVLTGAPGAVLLYPILGLVVYPRHSSHTPSTSPSEQDGLLSRRLLLRLLAGFWLLAALLQLQPYWWQKGQISGVFNDLVGQGGLNRFLVDPILKQLTKFTAPFEVPLNSLLILVFLGLGIALLAVKQERLRPFLALSIVTSVIIWWIAEAFGMLFTGMATDFNTGLLLVLMALVCWPKTTLSTAAQGQTASAVKQPEISTRVAPSTGS